MTVVDLAIGYAGVGAVIALVAIARGRASAVDALLLLALWPLYAPVVAGGGELGGGVVDRVGEAHQLELRGELRH
ncbi:MAG: hypothetical protein K8M05_15835, partial [Deltaproteobacteria bacterium]|nr:hypothetical protein [Kofleriaceae bacterium]